ncbi:MAG: hypothetical protein KCHDKBKB_01998 [Elusimicrobia bacterium]|nr:hypothetical protein [Elusimicrobiota bacterium]
MDPVRFISNPSTGSMGIALAEILHKQGVDVTLILGPTTLRPAERMKVIHVESALQMLEAVKRHIKNSDVFISTAAVGDWRFERTAKNKIKKSSQKTMQIKLVKNPDILAEIGQLVKPRPGATDTVDNLTGNIQLNRTKRTCTRRCRPGNFLAGAQVFPMKKTWIPARKHAGMTALKYPQLIDDNGRSTILFGLKTQGVGKTSPLLIGFALESENLKKNALKKLREKNLDLLIGNGVDSFGSPTIQPFWIEKEDGVKALPRMSKVNLSKKISAWLKSQWKKKKS